MANVRTAARITTGVAAALVAFLCSPRIELGRDVPQPTATGHAADVGAAAGFHLPQLLSQAHATMHVSTIANLPTVDRFTATILTRSPAEIDAFMHKLFADAAAARDARDWSALLRSTKQLMVLNEALLDRIIATEKE